MHNSKLIGCLFGFQTLLILFLVFQTQSLNSQLQELSAKTNTAIHGVSLAKSVSDNQAADNTDIHQANNSITIAAIRAVIVEELQKIKTSGLALTDNIEAKSASTSPALSQFTIDQMFTDVSEQIIALHGQGNVQASEIASIELAIVKLPPTERKRALQQLFKAVNSGLIDTRF